MSFPWLSSTKKSDLCHCFGQSQIQSHIVTDGQSVSESVSLGVKPQLGAHDQISITVWQLQ
jgi:hypothetical protein